ncbi:MAG TPA: cytochrome P450 [Stellaceae bacterium]|jgi:cytochrome P450|nr:cytochrome P450 [Stellaceae bacterium]
MGSYLQRFDATPAEGRWPLVRGWVFNEPLPFFAELREERPILVMNELTLVTRFADCTQVLQRYDTFSVALYQPKQGSYWMAQDDTAEHWREKSIMRAILDREDIPAIRNYVADKAAALLGAAGGAMDAVAGLTRAVPLALVQDWFGFTHSDPAKLCKWSYWNQIDAFWNQPFDAIAWADPNKIVTERELANVEMAAYLVGLVAVREGELKLGLKHDDSVARLLMLSSSGAVKFDLPRVILNIGGLLIGAVETTSHAVVNALATLMERPELLAQARAAALSDDPAAVDGFVFEALRFKPAFPYFFRVCEQDTVLGLGEDYAAPIAKGTTVLAVTHSAMFDPHALSEPDDFNPTRGPDNQFTFGLGLHACLGRAIGGVMIPEIVRQSLRLNGLKTGPVDQKGGPVPEAWQWQWS